MIFLIDHVLPDSYFANNLRALSVDMAVFRELLHFKLPDLAQHLDRLQKAAIDGVSGRFTIGSCQYLNLMRMKSMHHNPWPDLTKSNKYAYLVAFW